MNFQIIPYCYFLESEEVSARHVLPLALRQSISKSENVDTLSDIYCYNIITTNKDRLLHLAIWIPASNVVMLQREFGRDMNNDDALFYAFHAACEKNCIEIIKFLIECGADVNNHYYMRSPIHIAYDYPCIGIKVIKLLLENSADVNIQNNDGNTVLSRACSTYCKTIA
jgi:hypothetical protein